ncbi:Hsp70 family protein [uncultured Maritimibacter sp.]|uniref:Hsp70 family protein n=1 Tax=uncultured Maritimibacter sp. TaxID=991866 RepID=UPI000B2ABD8B|nr:Hsp70 family protein [uncultured Maritimibacter sp.]
MSDRITETLAIDFGTSNSAVAVVDRGRVFRLPLEVGQDTLPTAVFFPVGGKMKIGTPAGEALIAGDEGRYMRALKSVLGTTLFHEAKLIGGKRQTISAIVTAFLTEVKTRAEAMTGLTFTRVVSGRPVHFHSADPERDARAAEDLAACYRAAGFEHVRFVMEPEAAALANQGANDPAKLGLVVDIGGGTSDFTLFRNGAERPDILASHGIRLGGTDFDQQVSLTHVMPLLGHGGELRREFGPGLLPMPNAIYVDLATWARIPFLYAPETRREVKHLVKYAVEPERLERLETVLEDELGHDIAFAVERGKIAANSPDGQARIALGLVEPGLVAEVTRASLDGALAEMQSRLEVAVRETLSLAGVQPGEVGTIVMVGGSSLMSLVEGAATAVIPDARIARTEAFTAVIDGLALAIERRIGVPA